LSISSQNGVDIPGVDFRMLVVSCQPKFLGLPVMAGFVFPVFVALRSTTASMDQRELQQRAIRAFERAKGSQSDVARALGLNRSSVSRALRNEGLKHTAVQARIISILEEVPVQRRSTYRGSEVRHEWVVDPQ